MCHNYDNLLSLSKSKNVNEMHHIHNNEGDNKNLHIQNLANFVFALRNAPYFGNTNAYKPKA